MTDVSKLAVNKEFLESVIAMDFKLPVDVDPYNFCMQLLPNLGSPDPVLRDDLTATILDNIVSDSSLISGKQAEKLLSLLLDDNHLFKGIGEQDTDSVFMRTFSSLLSSSILYRDSITPSIDRKLVIDAIDIFLRYATLEKDFRGFVKGKGWAHSIAHLSDALFASSGHSTALKEQLIQILDTTGTLSRLDHPMNSGESERLAYAASKAILSLKNSQAVMDWIELYPVLDGEKNSPYAKYNSANFLRSLYFDLKWEENNERFIEAIDEKIRQLDPLYRNSKK